MCCVQGPAVPMPEIAVLADACRPSRDGCGDRAGRPSSTYKGVVRANVAACMLVLGLLGSTGCRQDRPPAAPGPLDTAVTVTPDGATSSGVRSGTMVVSNAPGSWGDDDYVLNAAAIAGDALTLNVSYGGGCATHRFTLVASETFMESFPVQLAVLLAHDANGDACEAWLTEDYRFDLRVIRDRYREAYGWGPGEVVLLLDDAPSGPLVYAFE